MKETKQLHCVFRLLLLLSTGLLSRVTAHDRIVYVNNSISRNASCVSNAIEEIVCPTLNLALQALDGSTIIYLHPAEYYLEPGNETQIWNQSKVSIVGLSDHSREANVTVNCQNETGLSFVYSNNILIKSVAFFNCSHIEISSSRNFYKNEFEYMTFEVAIYIKFCINVTLTNVVVDRSDGVGVTMYNTVGTVSLTDCVFVGNDKFEEIGRIAGGGGLQIEFFDPLFSHHSTHAGTNDVSYSSGAKYLISNTQFRKNKAHYRQSFTIFRSNAFVPDGKTYGAFNLGNGGGFSIILRGRAAHNSFNISHCHVDQNSAHLGGGFYVSFQEFANNNSINISHSNFTMNKNFDVKSYGGKEVYDVDGGGGGGKILYTSDMDNVMVISNCTFSSNEGISGGAIWIEAVLGPYSTGNHLTIKDSYFAQNKAFLGSALYFSGKFLKKTTCVVLEDIVFSLNHPLCYKNNSQNFAYLPCAGIIYSVNFLLTLQGKLSFHGNQHASPMEIHEGSLNISNGTQLAFINNTSQYGGALAFYDCSFMTLYPNTTLKFINNSAEVLGGAIYSASCSGSSQPVSASFRCFAQYWDGTTHPEEWNATLSFENNTVALDINDMYVTSLPSCWWPENGSDVINKADYSKTFCWSSWNFSGNCSNSYQSSPAFLTFKNHHDHQFVIYPGQSLPTPVIYDGTFTVIEAKNGIIVCIVSGLGSLSPNEMKSCQTGKDNFFLYYPNESFSSMSAVDDVFISVRLNEKIAYGPSFFVQYKDCQWPFTFSQPQCIYEDNHYFQEGTNSGIGETVSLKHQYCLTNESGIGLVVGLCPPAYNRMPHLNWLSTDDEPILDATSCQSHKSGRLCGGCTEQHGVPINSLHYVCHDCNAAAVPGSALFIILEIVPLTVFVALIFIFNVNLTTGVASGFLFYWQVITLNFPAWSYPSWLSFTADPNTNTHIARPATFLYSITNLNFLVIYDPEKIPICIFNDMESLGVIAFWYVVPAYTLLLILVLGLWLVLYDRGCRCVVCMTKPIHKFLARCWRKLVIDSSFIPSAASVYVFCFTQISVTSFKLLHYATWQSLQERGVSGKVFFYDGNKEYFGTPHLLFGLLAIVMLLVWILPLVLFLAVFPSRLMHRFVLNRVRRSKIKDALVSLGDAYTGCFKDNSEGGRVDFRYFASVLLFLRLVIMSFYYIPGQYSNLILYLEAATSVFFAGFIMILRPYRETVANLTNFFLFTLLALMAIVCLFFESDGALVNLVFIMHIPVPLAVVLVIRSFKERVAPLCNNYSTVRSDDHFRLDADGVPDRLEHPDDYHEQSVTKTCRLTQEFAPVSEWDSTPPSSNAAIVSGYGSMID